MTRNIFAGGLLVFIGLLLVFFSLYIGSNQLIPNALFPYIILLILASVVVSFGIYIIGRNISFVEQQEQQKIKKGLKKPRDFKLKEVLSMSQYKTVPGPVGLTIGSKDSYEKAVRSYAEIIQKEAVGGWEFFMMEQIPVTQRPGCIAGLLGAKETSIYFNMLVFKKD